MYTRFTYFKIYMNFNINIFFIFLLKVYNAYCINLIGSTNMFKLLKNNCLKKIYIQSILNLYSAVFLNI